MQNAKAISTSDLDQPPQKKGERRQVHEHVLSRMRRGLMVGAFLPGQVLSLRKLAAGLGTSPMPVREVLSRLVAAGALEETANGSVAPPRLGPDKLEDLFSIREALEGMAAEMAARKATPALIKELTAINTKLLLAIEKRDISGCLSFNQEFHFTLYRGCGSEVILPLIEALWLQFGPTMYMSLLVPSMPWNAADHGAILDALKKGEHAAVKRGIVHDIRTTKRALLTVLGENGMADLPFAARSELFGDF
ncbi:MAG: GntR family transcriptional regulator [Rhizobiales bacterium]|nr:GntR family transcriptional regulator [Hyphomicrobiales bacterium]|tara:strand:+ start:8203 stop:8952 length:750 start_codon:yes stop_codon:yes gene_type:complete